MQRLLLSVFLLVFIPTLWAQEPPGNLVPNWSFEIIEPNFLGDTICPGGPGQISLSSGWFSSAGGSVDYFNSCSNEVSPKYGTPSNLAGFQVPVDSGNAYAMIGCYSSNFIDAREFLMSELTDTLAAGSQYVWSIQISLADSMNFAIGGIGAYFSNESTQAWNKQQLFNVVPQVGNPISNLLFDKVNWVTVRDTFFATGNEKFITIGSFRPDSEENIQRVSDFPEGNYTWDVSAYYIDDISLVEISSVGIDDNLSTEEITVYPNPATDHITVRTNGHPTELRLLDPLGRTLLLDHPTQQDTQLNVSTLPKGIYFLQAHFPDGTRTTHRVIIN